jgi:type II secretory pathway component PulK
VKTSESGYVLIVVLWLVAILTVVTLGFGHRALLDRRAAANTIDQLQVRYMAQGAVARGIVALQNKGVLEQALPVSERSLLDDEWKRVPDLFNTPEGFSLGSPVEKEGEVCRVIVSDAESKISLNKAPEKLLEEVGIGSMGTIGEILDRRETDATKLSTPFVAVEEVLALTGVSERDWRGSRIKPGLRDLLTVWGDGLVNVNTASREVLQCIPDLSDASVDAIIAARPIKSIQELTAKASLLSTESTAVSTYCKVETTTFIIRGFATQRKTKVISQFAATIQTGREGFAVLDFQELPIAE